MFIRRATTGQVLFLKHRIIGSFNTFHSIMETYPLAELIVITVLQSAWFISCQSNFTHQGQPLVCDDTQTKRSGSHCGFHFLLSCFQNPTLNGEKRCWGRGDSMPLYEIYAFLIRCAVVIIIKRKIVSYTKNPFEISLKRPEIAARRLVALKSELTLTKVLL